MPVERPNADHVCGAEHMISFIKRLLGDRRGNALMIAGLSLPLVVGAAGLGTDTIQWVVWKRELQRAADSAAFAGVYAIAHGNVSMTAATAVNNDLGKNNHTMVSLLSGYPQIAYPTGTGFSDAVQVTLAVQRPLGFSGLFLSTAPVVQTSATAAIIADGNYCVVALAPSGSALEIGGSTNVQMGCGAISNSTDPLNAVGVNGNAHTFVADPVSSVGGTTATINGSSDVRSFQLPMEDPFADISMDVPSGMTCTNYNHPSKSDANGQKQPGCYNNFTPGNGTVTLNPGTYYLNSTDLSLAGQTRLVGNGVTIILTGSDPGSLTMAGNSSLDLTAPTSGPYANIVLMQSPNAEANNANKINGDNNTLLDGAVYFPRGNVELLGSSTAAFQCAMLVAYTVDFTGSSTIQNDTSGCDADMTVTGRRVRLIA